MVNPLARPYESLRVNHVTVPFSFWPVHKAKKLKAKRFTLFSSDPWAIMNHAVRLKGAGKSVSEAISLLEQAQAFYNASTSAYTSAALPVLLYYAYMNAVKAYVLHRGIRRTYTNAKHGISDRLAKDVDVADWLNIGLECYHSNGAVSSVYSDFMEALQGRGLQEKSTYRLRSIVPQIVAGHRLWSGAAKRKERFVSVERVEFAHDPTTKTLWTNVVVQSDNLRRPNYTNAEFVKLGLGDGWRQVRAREAGAEQSSDELLFESCSPIEYAAKPTDELETVVECIRQRLWATVLNVPPYRRYYVYLGPGDEAPERLPQMLSMYTLAFFFSSITRYRPQQFSKLLQTEYGAFVHSVLYEQPRQFLYLLASEFVQQEVAPAGIA